MSGENGRSVTLAGAAVALVMAEAMLVHAGGNARRAATEGTKLGCVRGEGGAEGRSRGVTLVIVLVVVDGGGDDIAAVVKFFFYDFVPYSFYLFFIFVFRRGHSQ